MKYYACIYVTGYTTVDGKIVEDKQNYRVGAGTDKYLIIDGRFTAENALMYARQWAKKHPHCKDIFFARCASFADFLDTAPDTMPRSQYETN